MQIEISHEMIQVVSALLRELDHEQLEAVQFGEAMLCQLRITEIQIEQKARQEAKAKGEPYTPPKNETNGEVRNLSNFGSKQFQSDAKLVASLPKADLERPRSQQLFRSSGEEAILRYGGRAATEAILRFRELIP